MTDAPKKVRVRHFAQAKAAGIRITGLTSYDFLTAGIFDSAGVDFLLIGDSAANVVFGYDTTVPVTIDELIPCVKGWCALQNEHSSSRISRLGRMRPIPMTHSIPRCGS